MANWNIDPDYTKAWIKRKLDAQAWNKRRETSAKRINRQLAAQDKAWLKAQHSKAMLAAKARQLEDCKLAGLARVEIEEINPGC